MGLDLRYFAQVRGDGQQTIAQWMAGDPRARRSLDNHRHAFTLARDRVPAAGELVRLSTIGSTRVGGLYRNRVELITPALTAAVQAIARIPAHPGGCTASA